MKFYTLKVVGKDYAEVTTEYVEYADKPTAVGVYRGRNAEQKAKDAIKQTGHDYEVVRL